VQVPGTNRIGGRRLQLRACESDPPLTLSQRFSKNWYPFQVSDTNRIGGRRWQLRACESDPPLTLSHLLSKNWYPVQVPGTTPPDILCGRFQTPSRHHRELVTRAGLR